VSSLPDAGTIGQGSVAIGHGGAGAGVASLLPGAAGPLGAARRPPPGFVYLACALICPNVLHLPKEDGGGCVFEGLRGEAHGGVRGFRRRWLQLEGQLGRDHASARDGIVWWLCSPGLLGGISPTPPASPVRLESAHESGTTGLAVPYSRHIGELGHHPPGLVVGVVAVEHPPARVGGVEVDRHAFPGPHDHGVLAGSGITRSDPP
jgi:hypothetical protein